MSFPSTGLDHYWNADSAFTDSVGGSDGTDTNTPTYTAGKINNALTCVAASSQYTSVSQVGLLGTTNTYTFNLWIKLSSTGGNQSIMMNYSTPGNPLFYLSGGAIIHSKGGVSDLSYTWGAIDTNWHMWTFVADGSGMRTYLDGNSTPVASNANTAVLVAATTTVPFGGYKASGTMQSGWYADMQMDEISISNVAWSTSDIATAWNGGAGLTYPDPSGASGFATTNLVVSAM